MRQLSKREEYQLSQLQQTRPVILLGMHRSGTSLTARLLRDLGIHTGSWLSRDAESVFFQRLNRRVLAAVGVKFWGIVDPLVDAMRSQEFVERQTDAMRYALFHDRHILRRGKGIARFFGRDLWEKVCRGESVPWGWKDPRTTITFPIWVRIFPRAHWVHIIRNGIDVAISTHRRTQKQHSRFSKRLLRIDYNPITLDFDYCFRLWETYISFVLNHKHLISSETYYEMRYEDLLREPQEQLRQLLDFLSQEVSDDLLRSTCQRIDRSRLDNTAYALSYRNEIPTLVSNRLMQQLGYDYHV